MTNQHDRRRQSGERLWRRYNAELSAAQADLAAYEHTEDQAGQDEAIDRISTARRQIRDLENLSNEYTAASQPPTQQPLTDSEMQALPPEKMSVGNALDLINRTSKYARDLTTDNAYVRHGWAIAQQRRQRGE